jgi:hypothetical protein
MEIKFRTVIEDYVNFNLYEYRTKPTYRQQESLSRLYSTILIVSCGLLISYAAGLTWILPGILVTLLVSVIFFISYKRSSERSLLNRLRKGLMNSDNDGLFGENRIFISPETIINEMPYGELKIFWKHVKKVVETTGYIYIYYAAERAFFIPNHAFANNEQRDTFIKMANEYWSEHRTQLDK